MVIVPCGVLFKVLCLVLVGNTCLPFENPPPAHSGTPPFPSLRVHGALLKSESRSPHGLRTLALPLSPHLVTGCPVGFCSCSHGLFADLGQGLGSTLADPASPMLSVLLCGTSSHTLHLALHLCCSLGGRPSEITLLLTWQPHC